MTVLRLVEHRPCEISRTRCRGGVIVSTILWPDGRVQQFETMVSSPTSRPLSLAKYRSLDDAKVGHGRIVRAHGGKVGWLRWWLWA
jgi:hypothetical protein